MTVQHPMTEKTRPMTRRAKLAASNPITAGMQLKSLFHVYPFSHSVQKSQSTTHVPQPYLQYCSQLFVALLQQEVPTGQQVVGVDPIFPYPTIFELKVGVVWQVSWWIGHAVHFAVETPELRTCPSGQVSDWLRVICTKKRAINANEIVLFIFYYTKKKKDR